MQYKQSRQDVTGLVVNKKVNIRPEYEKTARAMAHAAFQTGAFYVTKHTQDAAGNPVEVQDPGTLNQLQGIMSFIDSVKSSNWSEGNPRPEKRVGHERLYRKTLFYIKFFANEFPLILFEGKTDNIYIRCAIKRLYSKIPGLAAKKGKSLDFKVRFMSYTDTTSRILDLSGGTGELNKLVAGYGREWKLYKGGHAKNPVILFVDNDQGSKGLFKAIEGVTKTPVTGTEDFIYVGWNLYVVPTPKGPSGGDTMIEDFFPKTVRDQKVDGKKFNPGKNLDPAKEYGKYRFAEKVVRPQQTTINFDRFKPLLKRIVLAIDDYKTKV